MTGWLWPDTEISAVDLVAEYLPFNSVERKQSRCNNQRQVVAGSSPSLPDGSNPSAAIVQSASDVQCSRLLKTTTPRRLADGVVGQFNHLSLTSQQRQRKDSPTPEILPPQAVHFAADVQFSGSNLP
ncbi:hypothetical protein VAL12_006989 [Pseudomonas aeruginosa]|nr:hypothetical protein [Pseudomonas aeruginosa]EMB9912510.1 hypothetical protein [Pseudomonas aeruginosa]